MSAERMPWEVMTDESFTVQPDSDDPLLWENESGNIDDDDEHLAFARGNHLAATNETFATVDPDIIKAQRRKNGAKAYEDKVTDILRMAVTVTAGNPATVVDAAAILLHGDTVSYAFGDLAVTDANTARVINFLHGGTGNPATAAVMATLPLVLQILRNHEPELEHVTRINLPFTRGRVGFNVPSRVKLRISNNKIAASMTNPPEKVYAAAFTPAVVEQLADTLKVNVANYSARHRSD